MINRKFEECSADLADRIIKKSYHVVQKQSLFKAISSIFSDFYLPNPVYLTPLIFALGIFLSIYLYPAIGINDLVDEIYLSI